MDVKSISTQGNYESSYVNGAAKEPSSTINLEKVKEEQNNLKAPTQQITKKDLEQNIDGVNNFLETNQTSLKFQVHEDLDRLYVAVVDQQTKEVVREIPPKEFLDMISSMLDHVGLIVDKRV
ncbi:MAG: flagellar protein FlaG [Bacillaceae bacterium]|nr:flagellar protein FlaG [Bacillaceae bacterium]